MDILPINEFRDIVNRRMRLEFESYISSLKYSDEVYISLLRHMQSFLSDGGKRFRAYLAYLAYCGTDGNNLETIVRLAASLELLHGFLLIHDDIIDQDTRRYGKNNIVGIYQHQFNELSHHDALRSAHNVAILAGDIVHVLSTKIITELDIEDSYKMNLLRLFQEKTLVVAEGELVDTVISLGLKNDTVTTERILSMYDKKTASYTIELPLCAGIVASRGTIGHQTSIKEFGKFLGIAFQLQDDLIGIFGDPLKTGKSDDGDIREGKRTLIYMTALSTLKGKNLETFTSRYGRKESTQEEIKVIKSLLEEYGIRSNIEHMIASYIDQAEKLVTSLGLHESSQKVLQEVINKIKFRTV